jgi:hypothetical protein
MGKHHALVHRLLDRQDDYLRFARDWQVPLPAPDQLPRELHRRTTARMTA